MSAWVRAELLSRARQLAGLGAGGLAFMVILGVSYHALGPQGLLRSFGHGNAPRALQALSGSRQGDVLSPHGWMSFGFNHPLFLTVTLAVAISVGTAAIAGERESGRGELLFTRPVSRVRFLAAAVLVWAIAQIAVVAAATAGAIAGGLASSDVRRAGVAALLLAPVQYLPLAFLVAAVAFLASAAARTRGTALAASVGFVVVGYLLNFTSAIVGGLSWARWISPFGYYEPHAAVQDGIRWAQAAALVGAGLAVLAVTAAVLERRDLA